MAQQALAAVARGEDPAEQKEVKRKAQTMRDLCERYLEEHAADKKKPASIVNDKQMIRDYILPNFGHLKIEAVTRPDVARLHHDLRIKPIAANRVLALLSKMFSLAEKWGIRKDASNPCRHVERYKEEKRQRYLAGDELARLGTALAEAEGREHPSAILAIRLLLFTGCRLNEILTLKWSYVDLERGLLSLPDSKTGAKLVPLGGPATDAIKAAQRLELNPYVCFGDKPGHHLVGLPKIWDRIRKSASLPDVRIHDLRHSFASVAAAGNMGLPLIGALLGHSQPATTARYAHLAMDPLKAATDKISREIADAMSKTPEKKVIPIK